jgi:hypothetical protein
MIQVKKGKHGIDFIRNGHSFYDVSVSQIKLRGIDFWIDHLSLKNWFTHDVKTKFLDCIG